VLCGGAGLCQACRVRLAAGQLTPLTPVEEEALNPQERSLGIRLACQAAPLSDVKIDVPPESLTTPQRLQVEGQENAHDLARLDPAVAPYEVSLPAPSLADLRADTRRLAETLAQAGISPLDVSLPVLRDFPDRMRSQGWSARLALRQPDDRGTPAALVGVLKPGSHLFGLAVDVGTTKLAGYLVDLESGETAAKLGAMNPQIAFGEDVVSRIAYANLDPQNLARLQSTLIASLNTLLHDLCAAVQAEPTQVVDAVVVGNTAMHHLFAGLPVRSLGQAPYVPVVVEALELPAALVGLEIAPGAAVYLPGNIAGYVGADHVSMLLATGAWHGPEAGGPGKAVLALDIGTNTEISLAAGDHLLSCSCASGPAFEGAHIRDGMRAAPGAIERVQRISGEWRVATIGDQPPVGLCGSGILDAVAEMVNDGVVDLRGSLRKDHARVLAGERGGVFRLVPADESGNGREIQVTRKDVNEIQLAKAAIRAGTEILLAEAGLSSQDLQRVFIAGAFGTYLDLGNAVRVGMFPDLPLERFRQVGNAAGAGARQMLLSRARRSLADQIRLRVEYVELTTHAGFTDAFMKAISF